MKRIFLVVALLTFVYAQPYTIQVVAAQKQDTIEMMEKRAKAQGFSSVILQEGGLTKLIVGSYSTKAEAQRDIARAKKVAPDSFIRSVSVLNHASQESAKSNNDLSVQSSTFGVSPDIVYIPTENKCVFRYNCETSGIGRELPTVKECKKVIIDYDCK